MSRRFRKTAKQLRLTEPHFNAKDAKVIRKVAEGKPFFAFLANYLCVLCVQVNA